MSTSFSVHHPDPRQDKTCFLQSLRVVNKSATDTVVNFLFLSLVVIQNQSLNFLLFLLLSYLSVPDVGRQS